MSTQRWNAPDYQRIQSVRWNSPHVIVAFEDGTEFSVEENQIVPPRLDTLRWDEMSFTPFEIVVPTDQGSVDIPWTNIRVLTDPEFSAHMSRVSAEEGRKVGQRLKELRRQRKLSAKDLADRAGITPQSLSRIENGHHDVSMSTMRRLLGAMGFSFRDLVEEDPHPVPELPAVMRKLEAVGVSRDFFRNRLVPRSLLATLNSSGPSYEQALDVVFGLVRKIFGASESDLMGSDPIRLIPAPTLAARYKLGARPKDQIISAYTLYAHYLSLIALQAMPARLAKTLPTSAEEVREAVLSQYGEVSFQSLLTYTWSLGILVLPLQDPGAFHGACWRIGHRNVIVLKQVTRFHARWLFDLAHELAHILFHLSGDEGAILETEEISPLQDAGEEHEASQFASDLILDGRGEDLVQLCITAAEGSIPRLKKAVQWVAEEERVRVDSLSNYLAYRVSAGENVNWWGTANSLQQSDPLPFKLASDHLLRELQIEKLTEEDRTLLYQALEANEGG